MKKLASGLLAVTLFTGCGVKENWENTRGKGDAPVDIKDDSPADVTNFPDSFANIATKCVAGAPGFRVMVTTREAAPVVVRDETCDGAPDA
jgi:hypothetical protein